MRRYPTKFRLSTYNEGDFYRLLLLGRKAVAPGEKVSKLVADTRFVSPVFDKLIITPILVQSWAFYVPFRLVWDDWVDFIAQSDTVTQVPVTTVRAPHWFDGATSTSVSALNRRAFKLAYNEFFGDESYSSPGVTTWYDPLVDSQTDVPGLLIWDQYRSHMRERAYSSQNYLAAVSGGTATIVLDDLSRALRDNRARRRQKMTGDKYVDTMRLMGVELDWRVQMAPEFLGSTQQVVWPQERPSTSGNDLGARASSLDFHHQFVLKRPVAFAEHGVVIVVAGVRPLLGQTTSTMDARMDVLDEFFRPDTSAGPMDPASPANTFVSRNSRYLRGRNTVGLNQNGYFWEDPGAINDIYPTLTPVPLPPISVTTLSFVTDLSFGGLTPVPSGLA